MTTGVMIYARKEDASLTSAQVAGDIEAWEKQSGGKLPADYNTFLKNYFGGFPFPRCFDVAPDPWPEFLDENPQAVTEFYTWKHVQELISTEYYGAGYPQGYLIIGDAVSPVHLLLGGREDNFGKIYLWYHSTDGWGNDINNEAGLVFAANSFSDLIRSLYDDDSVVEKRNWERGARNTEVLRIDI